MNLRKSAHILGVVTACAVLSSPTFAALDVGVTTAISDAQANVVEAGGLIIGMAAAAMGLRWVKATFF